MPRRASFHSFGSLAKTQRRRLRGPVWKRHAAEQWHASRSV